MSALVVSWRCRLSSWACASWRTPDESRHLFLASARRKRPYKENLNLPAEAMTVAVAAAVAAVWRLTWPSLSLLELSFLASERARDNAAPNSRASASLVSSDEEPVRPWSGQQASHPAAAETAVVILALNSSVHS